MVLTSLTTNGTTSVNVGLGISIMLDNTSWIREVKEAEWFEVPSMQPHKPSGTYYPW